MTTPTYKPRFLDRKETRRLFECSICAALVDPDRTGGEAIRRHTAFHERLDRVADDASRARTATRVYG